MEWIVLKETKVTYFAVNFGTFELRTFKLF